MIKQIKIKATLLCLRALYRLTVFFGDLHFACSRKILELHTGKTLEELEVQENENNG